MQDIMKSTYSTFKSRVILMSKGIAMGTADIIPGVSGGTIALISGIYDHFIAALDSVQLRHIKSAITLVFFYWKKEKRQAALIELGTIEWQFLIPLFSGIIIALTIMIQIIPYIMEHYSFYAFSFFFGLIVFSISVPYKRMDHRWKEFAILITFALFTFVLVSMSRVSDSIVEFQPEFESDFINSKNIDYNISAKTNQKGQWEIFIPVDTMIDPDHPSCRNFSCFDLKSDSGFEIKTANDVHNTPGERALVYRGNVESAAGDKLGDFLLAVATIDYSSKEYQDVLTKFRQEHGNNNSRSSSLALVPRVVQLENNLKELDLEIKETKRITKDDLDMVYIKASIGSDGNHSLWMIFLSGALAICAMVLPGISGAYILVLLGQYQFITGTMKDLLYNLKLLIYDHASTALQHLILDQILIVAVFIIGIVIGLFSFVRILKIFLKSWHSMTMASLTGLMLGSLRYIWPPNHFEGEVMMWEHWLIFILVSITGAIAVFVLEFTANRLSDPDAPDPDIT